MNSIKGKIHYAFVNSNKQNTGMVYIKRIFDWIFLERLVFYLQ